MVEKSKDLLMGSYFSNSRVFKLKKGLSNREALLKT
jgi:hypothetical protein